MRWEIRRPFLSLKRHLVNPVVTDGMAAGTPRLLRLIYPIQLLILPPCTARVIAPQFSLLMAFLYVTGATTSTDIYGCTPDDDRKSKKLWSLKKFQNAGCLKRIYM